jgi:long-chain acyl-CoA synthetase
MAYQTLVELFNDRVAQSGSRTALRYRRDGAWRDISWREWQERSRKIAAGLAALGIEPGDRVAILSNSRVEWVIADLGALMAGAITAPIYQSNLSEEVAYIINDCEAKVVFCEDPSQLDKVYSERSKMPSLTRAIYMDRSAELEKPDARGRRRVELTDVVPGGADDFALSWEALLAAGEEELSRRPQLLEERGRTLAGDKLATLVYTSGTTGKPKGVMLTHKNFLAQIDSIREVVGLGPEDEQFMFLPLAHIFAKVLTMAAIRLGFSTAIDPSTTRIVQNCQEVKPTFMGAVPRVYEKAYAKIKSRPEQEGGLKLKIFQWAMGVGRQVSQLRQRGEEPSGLLAFQHKVADKLVFSKINANFGGRIRFFISAGAPLAREIAEFLHAANITVLEAYGLTETTGATHTNRPSSFKFGSVGLPITDLETKIAEDGEILVSGPVVLQGYYKKPEETAAVLEKIGDKIWFHTGDIGEIDPQGFLRITDRKKDLFKTSGGKYIAPQLIEGGLKAQSKYVSQVVAYGDNQNYVTALVTLNEETIGAWAQENGITAPISELAKDSRVIAMIQKDLDAVNQKLPSYETVKKFAVVYPDFSIESGELTPSLKVKRKVVTEKYKAILENFYKDSRSSSL